MIELKITSGDNEVEASLNLIPWLIAATDEKIKILLKSFQNETSDFILEDIAQAHCLTNRSIRAVFEHQFELRAIFYPLQISYPLQTIADWIATHRPHCYPESSVG